MPFPSHAGARAAHFHKLRGEAQDREHDRREFRDVCETVAVNWPGVLLLRHEIDHDRMLARQTLEGPAGFWAMRAAAGA